MFTVKHIDHTVEPPIENLYQGERVTFHPDAGNIGALEIRTGDTFIAGLWGGVAYVMNETGKTVSRFDLPPKPAGRAPTLFAALNGHHPDCALIVSNAIGAQCSCGASGDDYDRKTEERIN